MNFSHSKPALAPAPTPGAPGAPPYKVSLANILIQFNVGASLDKNKLIDLAPNMCRKQLMAVEFSLMNPHMNLLIFKQGKCQLMSATSMEHAGVAIWTFVLLLRRMGFTDVQPTNWVKVTMMATMDLGRRIDVKSFLRRNPGLAVPLMYKFDGLQLNFSSAHVPVAQVVEVGEAAVEAEAVALPVASASVSALTKTKTTVFASGKVNVIGVKTEGEAKRLMQEVVDIFFPEQVSTTPKDAVCW